MKKQTRKFIGALALASLVAGCADTGLKRTEKVETSTAKTRQNLQQTRQSVNDTLKLLHSLKLEKLALPETYAALQKQSKAMNEATARLKKNTLAMEAVGKARFDAWNTELSTIQNNEIKAESAKRMKEAQDKYTKLMDVLRKSEAVMTPFASDLNDIVKYLDLDLSVESIKKLSGPIGKALESGQVVQKWVDEVIQDLAEAEAARSEGSTTTK
jgi:predicted  nucleic acid-binding Zn-ribbon protein